MKASIIFHVLTLVGMLFPLGSCTVNKELAPKGPQITKKYAVTEFSRIASNAAVNIVFTQEAHCSVKASGPENYISRLNVSIKDSVLFIQTDSKNVHFAKGKMDIQISSPQLNDIVYKGVGDLKLKGNVRTESLSITMNGVGNVYAEDLHTNSLNVYSQGVGDLYLKGETETATYYTNGVGNTNAKEMIAQETTVRQSGVGNVCCHATRELRVTASGVGDVMYYGNPKEKILEKKGVGKVSGE